MLAIKLLNVFYGIFLPKTGTQNSALSCSKLYENAPFYTCCDTKSIVVIPKCDTENE